jgi:hypothetical protein
MAIQAGTRYTGGGATQSQASGELLNVAEGGAGALHQASAAARAQLLGLRQDVTAQATALSSEAAEIQSRLAILQSPHGMTAAAAFSFGGLFTDIGNAFSSLGNDISNAFSSAVDALKGVAEDGANAVASAILTAAGNIGSLAGSAAQAFAAAVQVFGQDSANLGASAIAGLKQFGTLVADGFIALAHDIANLFNGQIGIGYTWGGTATFYPTGGCDVGPYVDQTGLQPSAEVANVHHAALAAGALHLTAGTGSTVLAFHGAGDAPLVTLTGPRGLTLTTATGHRAQFEQSGKAAVIPDPTSDTTFIQFTPVTGNYQVTLQPGSVAITRLQRSQTLAPPSVAATVSGSGTHRVLHWRAVPIPGQTLVFSVQGAAGASQIVDTSAASGTVPFTVPAAARAARQVFVEVQQNGFSRAAMPVASFRGPVAPIPAAIRGLSTVRRGMAVTARWARVRGADSYRVTIDTLGGPHRTLTGVVPSMAVAVRVTALDGFAQEGAPAVRTLADRPPSRTSSRRAGVPVKCKTTLRGAAHADRPPPARVRTAGAPS